MPDIIPRTERYATLGDLKQQGKLQYDRLAFVRPSGLSRFSFSSAPSPTPLAHPPVPSSHLYICACVPRCEPSTDCASRLVCPSLRRLSLCCNSRPLLPPSEPVNTAICSPLLPQREQEVPGTQKPGQTGPYLLFRFPSYASLSSASPLFFAILCSNPVAGLKDLS